MGICPATLRGCCDDLCYGSGCLKGCGEVMFPCPGCGKPVSDDDSELCTCDYSDDDI